jgi:4-amino-4-deoxy-L-arabinose transferase-like glycosyltransferase
MTAHGVTTLAADTHGAAAHVTHRPALWLPGMLALAAAKFGLHLWVNVITPFSIHRDELLYLAMGKYLRFFHMDFPPLIAVFARLSHTVGGDSLVSIRFLPAVAGAALVVMAALLAREFGGGRLAQLLAIAGVLTAPLFLRAAGLFQPVVFDQLWWTVALFAVARVAGESGEQRRNWLLLGLAGGIGLLTKFSIGFIAVGIAAAILLSPLRTWLRTPWPYVAAGVALIVGCASIVGQVNLGFPVAQQMSDLQDSQLALVSPQQFTAEQALLLGPAILLAVAGAAGLLFTDALRRWRPVGIACLATFLLLMLLRGKAYYVGPIYPALLAAGAVLVERMRYSRAIAGALTTVMVAFAVVGMPVVLPVASPEDTAARAEQLGITSAVTTNRGDVLRLPQDFADMLGWREQVAAAAAVYHALPPADREQAVIITSNYGEAGAVDFFGPAHGLPRAVAPIGSYWFFGPGDLPGNVAVTIGLEYDDLAPFFDEVRVVQRVSNPWGVPEQRNVPVALARGIVMSLQEAWPAFAGRN